MATSSERLAALSPQQLDELARRLGFRASPARGRDDEGVPSERPADIPLSDAQRGVWLVHQLRPVGAAYNERVGLRLGGVLDVDALSEALRDVVQRHEILRTRVATAADGTPIQAIETPAFAETIALEYLDVGGIGRDTQDAEAAAAR